MQNIHQLALVLVQTLYLNIVHGARVDINAVMLFNIFCQTNLVLVLDVHKFLLAFFIGSVNLQLFNMR